MQSDDQLACLHGEIHRVDGGDAEEPLGEAAHLEERHRYDAGARRRRTPPTPSGQRMTTTSSRSP